MPENPKQINTKQKPALPNPNRELFEGLKSSLQFIGSTNSRASMRGFFGQIEELKKSNNTQAGIYLITLYHNIIKAAELVINKEYGVVESEEDKQLLIDKLLKELLQKNDIPNIETWKQSIMRASQQVPDAGTICGIMNMKHIMLENNVILEPDERERIFDESGYGESTKGSDINRMTLVSSILLSKGIDLTTLTSYEGTLNDTQMRSTSYVMIPLPIYGKTLFICNSYGEATFVVNELLGPDDLPGISKKLLNQSGTTRIIRNGNNPSGWMNRVEQTLTTADIQTQTKILLQETTDSVVDTEVIKTIQDHKRANVIKLWQESEEFQKALSGNNTYQSYVQGYNQDRLEDKKIILSFKGFAVFCNIRSSEKIEINGEKKEFFEYLVLGSVIKLILKKYIEKNKDLKMGEKNLLLTKEETMEVLNIDFDQLNREKIIQLWVNNTEFQEALNSGADSYQPYAQGYNKDVTQEEKIISGFGGFAIFSEIKSSKKIEIDEKGKVFSNYLGSSKIIKAILNKYIKMNHNTDDKKDIILTKEQTMEIISSFSKQKMREKIIQLWEKNTEFQEASSGEHSYRFFVQGYNKYVSENENIILSFGGFTIFSEIKSREKIEIGSEKKEFNKYLGSSQVIKIVLKKYIEINRDHKKGERDRILTREETMESLNKYHK